MEEQPLKKADHDLILALFDEHVSLLLQGSQDSQKTAEKVITERIRCQLQQFHQATQFGYERKAELMGLVLFYTLHALKELKTPLDSLLKTISTITQALPNRDKILEGFLKGTDKSSLAILLHNRCTEMMKRLMTYEQNKLESHLKFRQLINVMVCGHIPFSVNFSEYHALGNLVDVNDDIFKPMFTAIAESDLKLVYICDYTGMTSEQYKKEMPIALAHIAKRYPDHYEHGGSEAALIAHHLVLLKSLLNPKVLEFYSQPIDVQINDAKFYNTELYKSLSKEIETYGGRRYFINFFNRLYDFFQKNNLTAFLTESYLGDDKYKLFQKFHLIWKVEQKATAIRITYSNMVPANTKPIESVSVVAELHELATSMIKKNVAPNLFRDLLTLFLTINIFNSRIRNDRADTHDDVLQFILARVMVTHLTLKDWKIKLTKEGNYEETTKKIDYILSSVLVCFGAITNHLTTLINMLDTKSKSEQDQDTITQSIGELNNCLGNDSVDLLSILLKIWYHRWDNNQPIQYEQAQNISEKLLLAMLTERKEDIQDLKCAIVAIILPDVKEVLKQHDEHQKSGISCIMM